VNARVEPVVSLDIDIVMALHDIETVLKAADGRQWAAKLPSSLKERLEKEWESGNFQGHRGHEAMGCHLSRAAKQI
jgi:hypothetical protein